MSGVFLAVFEASDTRAREPSYTMRKFEDGATGSEHHDKAASRPSSGGSAIPPELVREAAARLKALSKALPYEEYAAIVYRVARLKWRCTTSPDDGPPCTENDPTAHAPEEITMEPATRQLWGAVLVYHENMMLRARSRTLLDRARRARADAVESCLVSASQRANREEEAEAHATLRLALRDFVAPLKAGGESLDTVLRRTGELLDFIRISGAVNDDQGSLDADVMRLAAEEYCTAA